jgi:lipopolysaccharide biosynthesis glycosyltransferase
MSKIRQAAVTVASGPHAEKLDRTFTSFAQNPFLELHAFIIGDRLPERQLPGITYHLEKPDPSFSHPMREIYYRRMVLIDKLDVEFAVVMDNHDVLCLQSIPELPTLLRGAAFGACVEHRGGRYILGQGYTGAYFNAGVTYWNIPASRRLREAYYERGRSRYRSVEDQLTLNEVVHALFYDDTIILPCQYNYRPCLAPVKKRDWPTVTHLDGVKVYHNIFSLEQARKLIPVKSQAELEPLPVDPGPLTSRQQFWRRLHHRLFYRERVR